ncbi:MAG: lantibiotic dehydratase C-terminal domain-containing protein [Bacteroidota bacterium]
MFSEAENKWLTVNLFYNEPWEAFLSNAVKPYLDTLVQMGIIGQFHFLRYWERGPHIRLRIRGEATVLDNLVHHNLIEHFENYFESKPSRRTDPNYPPNFPTTYKWYPNNSVQLSDYNTTEEQQRYGGTNGLWMAQQQFTASSEIVLRSLKAKGEEWSYDEALGLAIKLQLSFIHTMGLDMERAIAFFGMLFKNWLPRAFRFQNRGYNTTIYLHKEQKTMARFEDAFELQRDSLLPFHSALWSGLHKDGDFEDQDLNFWIAEHERLNRELSLALELNQLQAVPAGQSMWLPPNLTTSEQLLWPIFADWLHLNCNRLGISNKDEGFIAYLIMRSLKEIQQSGQPTAVPRATKSKPLSRQ